MKKLFYLLLLTLFATNSQAAIKVADVNAATASVQLQKGDMDHPAGISTKMAKNESKKKLGFFKKMKMKLIQKFLKKKAKNDSDISQGLYIVLSIFWLGWLAMGILDDWDGNNWIIGLLLYVIFYIPGLIFSLIKMGDYY